MRWVVHTLRTAGGFTTTARRTGCDLTPFASATSPNERDARDAHARFCAAIAEHGTVGVL